jgi:hypothetical protein
MAGGRRSDGMKRVLWTGLNAASSLANCRGTVLERIISLYQLIMVEVAVSLRREQSPSSGEKGLLVRELR